MQSIKTKGSSIYFGKKSYSYINEYITNTNPSKIIVIVDSNTRQYCLRYFLSQIHGVISIDIIEIPEGEIHKTITTCDKVWQNLLDCGADRTSLIINLGGGVVTDLGGFVASTYMRGINFINVPTSLLAMVDASVGGKTGVDLGVIKNLVGVFSEGVMVLIDTHYLDTLPALHKISGFAEMLKHGLIYDENYWNQLKSKQPIRMKNFDKHIYSSIQIKHQIVSQDQKEEGLRKILNFGHTLGHAIESYFLQSKDRTTLLHGEAIAIGIILESYLSYKILDFSERLLFEITTTIVSVFGKIKISNSEKSQICSYLKHDKKNSHGNTKFVLLKQLGKPIIDCSVNMDEIDAAFEYYENIIS